MAGRKCTARSGVLLAERCVDDSHSGKPCLGEGIPIVADNEKTMGSIST